MNRPYAVVDDFLTQQDHLNLWDAFQDAGRSAVGTRDWNRVYQLAEDGALGASAGRPLLQDGTAGGSVAPRALRVFSETLFALMSGRDAPVVIDRWTGFTQSAWIYRPGDGLEWHSDTGWLGAYIYYLHPVWRASWGGELLVAPGAVPAGADGSGSAVEAACRAVGAFIHPLPNRLVLMRGGTFHCIKKVERAAGDAFRASVSGFFHDGGVQVPG